MSLKEACIIVPVLAAVRDEGAHEDNLHWAALKAELIALAGGITITQGHGAWATPAGNIVAEPVFIVTFAVSQNEIVRPNVDRTIAYFAACACRDFKQEAIYFRYPDGEVVILDRAKADAIIELGAPRH